MASTSSGAPVPTSFLPGVSFGAFRLGADFLSVAKQLKAERARYGPFVVEHPEPSTEREEDESVLFNVQCPQVHIVFQFDYRTQRLHSVIVDNVIRCGELAYKGRTLCGSNQPPTFVRIYEVLGPTFQGEMDADEGIYTLQYPGLDISFSIPEQFRAHYAGASSSDGAHPMTLPDGSTPVACLLVISYPDNVGASRRGGIKGHQQEIRQYPPVTGRIFSGDQVALDPFSASNVHFLRSGQSLHFGMTPQDIVAILGTPEQVFPKQDDRLLIHNPSLNQQTVNRTSPSYFMTYPLLGIDCMFDGVSNTLVKIMCFHSTGPAHSTFLKYLRCFFQLTSSFMPAVAEDENSAAAGSSPADGASVFDVTSESNFYTDVKPFLPRCPAPLLSSSSNGTALKIYCFKGVILYVVAETGSLDSVLLFKTDGLVPPPLKRSTDAQHPAPSTKTKASTFLKQQQQQAASKTPTLAEPGSTLLAEPAAAEAPTGGSSVSSQAKSADVSPISMSMSARGDGYTSGYSADGDESSLPPPVNIGQPASNSATTEEGRSSESQEIGNSQPTTEASPTRMNEPTSEFRPPDGEETAVFTEEAPGEEEQEVESPPPPPVVVTSGKKGKKGKKHKQQEPAIETPPPATLEEALGVAVGPGSATSVGGKASPWGAPPPATAWGKKKVAAVEEEAVAEEDPPQDEEEQVQDEEEVEVAETGEEEATNDPEPTVGVEDDQGAQDDPTSSAFKGGISPLPEEDLVSAPPTAGGDGDGGGTTEGWETMASASEAEAKPSLFSLDELMQTQGKKKKGTQQTNNNTNNNSGGGKGKKGKKGKK